MRQPSRVAKEIADFLEGKSSFPAGLPKILVPRATLERWILFLVPPKRKVRPRDVVRTARKTSIKELDRMCRAVVFARDRGTCRKCGMPAKDWSHVFTRGIHNVRWDLDGSFASCKGCHLRWHARPTEAKEWWESEIGSARMSSLALRANGKRGKPNHEAIRATLEQEAKALGVTL